VRAAAGEKEKPAQGEKEGEKEKVDYRLYQALMRGGEEVISVLKEITELVSAFFSSFSFSLSLSLFIGGQSVEKTNSEMAVGSWKT
jgi:hypothetical protein